MDDYNSKQTTKNIVEIDGAEQKEEDNSVRSKRKDQITTYPIQKEPNCSLKKTMNSPNNMLMSVETNCPICHFQFSTKENLKINLKKCTPNVRKQ